MGDHRYGDEIGERSTATTIKDNKDDIITKDLTAGLMSPRSVKSNTFDDTARPENANPYHDPSTLIPPIVASSGTSMAKTIPRFPGAPDKEANKSTDHSSGASKTTTNSNRQTPCQRRVIFPTYRRDQQQIYSWSWMSLHTRTPCTSATGKDDATIVPKTGGTRTPPRGSPRASPESPPRKGIVLKPQEKECEGKPPSRRASVLPLVPSLVGNKVAGRISFKDSHNAPSSSIEPTSGSSRNANAADPLRRPEPQPPATCQVHCPEESKDIIQLLLAAPPPTPSPGDRRITAVSPDPSHDPILAHVKKEPHHRSAALPTKPILRLAPKYGPPVRVSSYLARNKPQESSLPSLVDIKEDANDDDESQSCTSNDDSGTSSKSNNSTPVMTPVSTDKKTDATQASATLVTPETPQEITRGVGFDPRVWVREFHRAPEEAERTWYSDDDMDNFRRMALERIVRYQSTLEIIPTGTGRTVQRRTISTRQPWKGPIYSHAALTLDGENNNDIRMRGKVMEKELHRILIVDPQDLCLKLFTKALQNALPSRATTIETASSSSEALKHLEQGKRFDMIIVEERLQLFHRYDRIVSEGNSSTCSWLRSPKDISNRKTAQGACGAIMSSGSALIQNLKRSPLTANCLIVGVSAHLKEDEPKLRLSGADYCWPKPPPPLDECLLEELVKTLLIKRGQSLLATELFG